MKKAKQILSEILSEARPGAHWNQWPSAASPEKKEIDLDWLEFKYSERNNPGIAIPGATPKDWKMIADLIKAIKTENVNNIKVLITKLVKSPLSGVVGPHEINWSWAFADLNPRVVYK
jgi:hypothetical protein